MQILVIVLSLILSAFAVRGVKAHLGLNIPMWLLIALLAIKITAAMAITNFYDEAEEREMADVYKYYDNGLILAESFSETPFTFFKLLLINKSEDPVFTSFESRIKYWGGQNRMNDMVGNRLLIRTNAVFSVLFFKNYYANLIAFTLLSFIGLLYLTAFVGKYISVTSSLVLAILSLSPSVLFWSSGILKESMIVFGLGLFLYSLSRKSSLYLLIGFFSICMLYVIKLPLLLCTLPAGLFYVMHKYYCKSISKSLLFSLGTSIAIGIVVVLSLNYNIVERINQKRIEYVEAGEINGAESSINSEHLKSISDVILLAPKALTTALFRPTAFEVRKASYIPFALESSALILLILVAFIFKRKNAAKHQRTIWTFLLILIPFALIIGYTVPILGSIVRYRAPIIPLLILICIVLIDWNKVLPKYSTT